MCKYWANIEKHCTNIGQIMGIYCAIIGQILCKNCKNVVQILGKYCANIGLILCKYLSNIVVIMGEKLDEYRANIGLV